MAASALCCATEMRRPRARCGSGSRAPCGARRAGARAPCPVRPLDRSVAAAAVDDHLVPAGRPGAARPPRPRSRSRRTGGNSPGPDHGDPHPFFARSTRLASHDHVLVPGRRVEQPVSRRPAAVTRPGAAAGSTARALGRRARPAPRRDRTPAARPEVVEPGRDRTVRRAARRKPSTFRPLPGPAAPARSRSRWPPTRAGSDALALQTFARSVVGVVPTASIRIRSLDARRVGQCP